MCSDLKEFTHFLYPGNPEFSQEQFEFAQRVTLGMSNINDANGITQYHSYSAFLQSALPIHALFHTPTVESTTQGDSHQEQLG